jgi:hypothetical protein
MKRFAVVLALVLAAGCSATRQGPTLPDGGHWVNFTSVSIAGPQVGHEGILLAATSIEVLRQAVVAYEISRNAELTAARICPANQNSCWREESDNPSVLYLAIASPDAPCDSDVKEAAALSARTLYFIEWMSGPNGAQCGDAGPPPRYWWLLSVSRQDLPSAGTLTVRLQVQSDRVHTTSNVAESQVELT